MNKKKPVIFIVSLLILGLFLSSLTAIAFGASSVTVNVDSGNVIRSNNLSLGYMLDHDWKVWRDSPTQIQYSKNANFKLVRLFSVRIEPCSWWYESSYSGQFNWANVDSLIQKIFDAGAEPLICFGRWEWPGGPMVVPPGMAINPSTNLPYPDSYAAYVATWLRHFKSVGFNVRYYEIGNEPYFYYGWDTSETWLIGNFVQLYNTIARSMRSINSGVLISTDGSITKKFLDYFIRYGERIDYIDVHKYGLDEDGGSNEYAFNQAENYYLTSDTICNYNIDHARQIWYDKRGVWLPVIASEANFSYAYLSGTDWRNQEMPGAVYTALGLKEFITRGYNYYSQFVFASSPTYSRINWQGGYGFGMINWDNNRPWYPYYVMEMVGSTLSVGDSVISTTSSSSYISTVAWIHNGKLYILLISKADWWVPVYLQGVNYPLSYSKIDNTINWENAAVQTGNLYSGQALELNGYTVVLLQTNSYDYAQTNVYDYYIGGSQTYIEDHFDSWNFNQWSGVTTTSGDSITINSFTPTSGHHVSITTNGDVSRAYIYKDISGASSVYAKMWVYADYGLPLGGWNALWLVQFLDSGGSVVASYGMKSDNSETKWAVMKSNMNAYSGSGAFNDNWYLIEAYYTQAASGKTIKLYVNGAEQASLYTDTSASRVSRIRLGIGYTDTWMATRVYMNDVTINAS